MPPKFKTSKEEILKTGLALAREGGLQQITARELGHRLNLSSRPVYSFYPSIEQLKKEVVSEIVKLYEKALMVPKSDDPFFNVGLGQVQFAIEESSFYTILQKHYDKTPFMDRIFEKMKNLDPYSNLPIEELEDLYIKMAIFTDGLAECIIRKRVKDTSNEAIRKLVYETGYAILMMKIYSLEEQKSKKQ